MNIILTNYIYPIEEAIILNSRLNVQLDNPRGKKEIEAVKKYINVSNNSVDDAYSAIGGFGHRIPMDEKNNHPEILTINGSMNDFQENYSNVDPVVGRFFDENKDDSLVLKLSKMWIVLRYDDEGAIEDLIQHHKEMKENNPNEIYFTIIGDENPIEVNSQKAVDYTYLLSLLVHTEDNSNYYGKTFMLHHQANEINDPKIDRFLNLSLLYFGFMSSSAENNHEEDRWKSFYHIKDEIIKASSRIDAIYDAKWEYISSVLRSVGENIKDNKQKLAGLTSLVELLLTHSPDYNRFNVEESISKQFRLKMGAILYLYDNSTDMGLAKNRLRDIYTQRSNIAHGNFGALEKFILKEKAKFKKEEREEVFVVENIISDLYFYIKAIAEVSIDHPILVEYLKAN